MTALNLSFAQIKDAKLFAEYVQKASALMQDFDVEVVARGDFADAMTPTDAQPTVGAVFRYPNLDVARAFFASDVYLEIVPLRDRACEMTILLFDEATTAPSSATHA